MLSLSLIISCESNEVQGYYAGSFQEGKNYREFGINRFYYRINGDTIVEMTLAVPYTNEEMSQDMKVDSVRYVWNGEYYEDIYNESTWNIPIKIDDKKSVQIGSFKYGDKKYKVLGNQKITFHFDSTKTINDSGVKKNRDGYDFDILTPVNKLYIKNSLLKDKKKDSLAFHEPIISDEKLHESILDFLDIRFEEGLYGEVNYSSIETQSLQGGEFFVKFKTGNKANPSIERENIYLFDFTLAGFGVKRVN